MTAHNGYLLIADISGYTAFLTSSELDHANPILQSLLTSLVEQVGDPLHFWRMDGDAVLAYSTDQEFPSGETFLSICENLYNAFATRRRDIIANTTCPCRACANVENLDLKIMALDGRHEGHDRRQSRRPTGLRLGLPLRPRAGQLPPMGWTGCFPQRVSLRRL